MQDPTNNPDDTSQARDAESPARRRLAIWQTEVCPHWCKGGHVDAEHPNDRDHFGNTRDVQLHLMRAVDFGFGDEHDWRLPELHVAVQAAEGGTAFVHIYSDDIGEHSIQLDLSRAEARLLAGALAETIAEALE